MKAKIKKVKNYWGNPSKKFEIELRWITSKHKRGFITIEAENEYEALETYHNIDLFLSSGIKWEDLTDERAVVIRDFEKQYESEKAVTVQGINEIKK